MIKLNSVMQGELGFYTWSFPGGEIGVKLDTDLHAINDVYAIHWTGIPSMNELMVIAQLVNAIRGFDERCTVILNMPYLPYARQDRVCNKGEAFALECFVQMLSSIWIDTIYVKDVHSEVGLKLLKQKCQAKIVEIPQFDIVQSLLKNYDLVISPDTGAAHKLVGEKRLCLTKVRENGTVKYERSTNDLSGLKVLVVDDICDGGATFISLAQNGVTNRLMAKQFDLFVTHGIFSRGTDELKMFYNNIYCHNLMQPTADVTVI